jgi:hypothetical protein
LESFNREINLFKKKKKTISKILKNTKEQFYRITHRRALHRKLQIVDKRNKRPMHMLGYTMTWNFKDVPLLR